MTYLAVFESDTWRLGRNTLARVLARDWPQVQVRLASPGAEGSDVRDLEWLYRSELGELEGHAHADGQGIYLEGAIEVVADFVIWYRRLVPDEVQIVFCDDSYSFDGVVPPKASREYIVGLAQ